MNVRLNDSEYSFFKGYQKDAAHRTAFNNLVTKVFGISFEDWYSAGYWNEKYIPYTLFDGGKAVANVSVNVMDFNVIGKQQRFIQIGTVATDEEYRNKHLSRFLMEKILAEWGDQCDLIYLFANKTVLEMYPKFGFGRVQEHEYFKSVEKSDTSSNIEKLDMDIQANRDFLYDYARNTKVYGNLSMHENADLVMFYCTSFLKRDVYYIKSLDVIAVATYNENRLHLLDVFGKVDTDLDKIISSLVNPQINEVVLGFTPKDCSSYEVRETHGDDALFVQKGKSKLFDKNKVMFPLLSHA